MVNNKILGLLGLATRAGVISFGTESSKDTIIKRKAKLVIIANDTAERTKKNFIKLCEEYNVPIKQVSSIEELSNAIGQSNKAVICIKDKNFSNGILKIIDGGEVIG